MDLFQNRDQCTLHGSPIQAKSCQPADELNDGTDLLIIEDNYFLEENMKKTAAINRTNATKWFQRNDSFK